MGKSFSTWLPLEQWLTMFVMRATFWWGVPLLVLANLMGTGLMVLQYAKVSDHTMSPWSWLYLWLVIFWFLSVVDCLNLTDPSNGQVLLSTTTFRSIATYSCEEGYILIGIPMRECQSNGSWSEEEPSCESKLWLMIPWKEVLSFSSLQLSTVLPFLIPPMDQWLSACPPLEPWQHTCVIKDSTS